MTWTVFEHRHGTNETTEDAPGRGGYSTVLVPLPAEDAALWWEDEYGKEPGRGADEQAWSIESYEQADDARAQCGELELDQGAIGSPMKRLYTWDELKGRLDVRVVDDGRVGEIE